MIFGDRLKDLRESKHISQLTLAKMTNTAQNVISRYERGITKPNIEHIVSIANALSTTTDYLLGVSDIVGTDNWTINYLCNLQERLSKSELYDDRQKSVAIKYTIEEIIKEKNRKY